MPGVYLDPDVKRAFAEELLHQNHLFRENAALQHGLPDPGPRVVLRDRVFQESTTDSASPPMQYGGLAAQSSSSTSTTAGAPPSAVQAAQGSFAGATGSPASPLAGVNGLPAPEATKLPGWLKAVGLGSMLLGAGSGGGWATYLLSQPAKAVAPVVATAPAAMNPTQVLDALKTGGFDKPTPLATSISEAMQKDPALRERFMAEVRRTLDQPANGPKPNGK